jgi:ASC-1-like (ASCH) protein
MRHDLKILPQYFEEVYNGNKTFEIRKNDRDFKVGDILMLREWIVSKENGEYDAGGYIQVVVKYITNFAQQDDYVVMSFDVLQKELSCMFRE